MFVPELDPLTEDEVQSVRLREFTERDTCLLQIKHNQNGVVTITARLFGGIEAGRAIFNKLRALYMQGASEAQFVQFKQEHRVA